MQQETELLQKEQSHSPAQSLRTPIRFCKDTE